MESIASIHWSHGGYTLVSSIGTDIHCRPSSFPKKLLEIYLKLYTNIHNPEGRKPCWDLPHWHSGHICGTPTLRDPGVLFDRVVPGRHYFQGVVWMKQDCIWSKWNVRPEWEAGVEQVSAVLKAPVFRDMLEALMGIACHCTRCKDSLK